VVVDPNKRDLLYCLGSNGKKMRYTQSQRSVETRSKKYRKIREALTIEQGKNSNPMNVVAPKSTCNYQAFDLYLREFFYPNSFRDREVFYRQYLFRKLKLNTYINTQKSESQFINKFKKTYGDDTPVIIGDWDSHNFTPHGQITTKGKGFRNMFRRSGLTKIYLIDEYKTSKTCPRCHGVVETFKKRRNPKPWKNNIVTVHGLLRCQSENCQQACGYGERYFNRDDVSTVNMMYIVKETRNTGSRPAIFCRKFIPS
jgi:hypothetical protein